LKDAPEQQNTVEPYEAPTLVVIGAVREFTFGSGHDNSDNSITKTDGGHR
jgi:hypothetical protein